MKIYGELLVWSLNMGYSALCSLPGISSGCPPCTKELLILAAPSGGARVNLNNRSISGAEQAWTVVLTLFLCCCTKGEAFPRDPTCSWQRFGSSFPPSDIWSCSLFISLQVFMDTLAFWWLPTWKAIHLLCYCFSFCGIMMISTARMTLGMKCNLDTSNLNLLQ